MVEQTKNAEQENFPVASKLILPHLRPAIMSFYDFARTSDDIADSDTLTGVEKMEMLNEMEAVLCRDAKGNDFSVCAEKLVDALKERPLCVQSAKDLLKAFRMDATNQTYDTFDELMRYCRYSAGSVGRFMLDLHQESPTTYLTSDALCAALQLNNHLQDCKDDFIRLKRFYLPKEWMKEENLTCESLLADKENPALRRVFNKMISGIDGLLTDATPLPMAITGRGLRMQVCVIYRLAKKLSYRLKKQDILTKKVELRPVDWFFAFTFGALGGLRRKKIKCPINKTSLPPKQSF